MEDRSLGYVADYQFVGTQGPLEGFSCLGYMVGICLYNEGSPSSSFDLHVKSCLLATLYFCSTNLSSVLFGYQILGVHTLTMFLRTGPAGYPHGIGLWLLVLSTTGYPHAVGLWRIGSFLFCLLFPTLVVGGVVYPLFVQRHSPVRYSHVIRLRAFRLHCTVWGVACVTQKPTIAKAQQERHRPLRTAGDSGGLKATTPALGLLSLCGPAREGSTSRIVVDA
jgi:hypothetical protein